MEQLAPILKALADPSRVRIVNILSIASLSVCDLQTVLGFPQPFISRHLAFLRKVRFVRDVRQGPRVVYSLARAHPFSLAITQFLRASVLHSPRLQADVERLESCRDSGRLAADSPQAATWEESGEDQDAAV